jgi:hypothetical protein
MSTPAPAQWGPSMSGYQKLAGEVGGLIESVRQLTGRVEALEREVAEPRAGGGPPREQSRYGVQP